MEAGEMFRRCPLCGRLFQAKEVNREQLENPYEVQVPKSKGGFQNDRIENFRITYKRNNCGHEWTDVNAKTLMTTLIPFRFKFLPSVIAFLYFHQNTNSQKLQLDCTVGKHFVGFSE
jgi:hypothetical protein